MASERTEDLLKQGKREPRRDSAPSTAPSKPIRAPFLSDGLESVRDTRC